MSLHIPASELAYQLPADAMYHLNYTLSLTLPPLPDDTPETLARRNNAIIARISGLRPTDAPQAEYAAQFVSASENWKHCQRLSHLYEATDPRLAAQCRNQAAAMMRQAERAERALQRLQAASKKLYADPAATDAAERTEHVIIATLADAQAQMPEPDPALCPVPAKLVQPQPALVSKTSEQPRKHKNETPARQMPSAQAERPYESPARRAMLDQAMFGRREPDPNRRYPGESGAQLLMRRRQDADPPPAESPLAGMTRDAEQEMAVSCP